MKCTLAAMASLSWFLLLCCSSLLGRSCGGFVITLPSIGLKLRGGEAPSIKDSPTERDTSRWYQSNIPHKPTLWIACPTGGGSAGRPLPLHNAKDESTTTGDDDGLANEAACLSGMPSPNEEKMSTIDPVLDHPQVSGSLSSRATSKAATTAAAAGKPLVVRATAASSSSVSISPTNGHNGGGSNSSSSKANEATTVGIQDDKSITNINNSKYQAEQELEEEKKTAAAASYAASSDYPEVKESAHLKLRTMHLDRQKVDDVADTDSKKMPSKWLELQAEDALAGKVGNRFEKAPTTDSSSENNEESASSSGGEELPPGMVWLLEYGLPGVGPAESEQRFASLGDDVSKFAIFLDSVVHRDDTIQPQSTVGRAAATTTVNAGVNGAAPPREGSPKSRRSDSIEGGSTTEAVVVVGEAASTAIETTVVAGTVSMDEKQAGGANKGQHDSPRNTGKTGVSAEVEALEAEMKKAAAATLAAAGGSRWASGIMASTVEIADEAIQKRLQTLWEQGRLLSQEQDARDVLRGREQSFSELLSSYATRTKSNHWEEIPQKRLLEFLQKEYDPEVRSLCGYDPDRSTEDTLSSLKGMLEWFRQEFPYYYDGCHSCGNRGGNTFVGYVYPSKGERAFRAGRTEVYHCSACGSVSRFARYAAVSKVLETQRGRCGEYSVLMLRLLEALGYVCRWVVDWSDHVWVEAKVAGRWIHVDPCEAAVDEPLLYESWGKNQTYILAFSRQEVVDVTDLYTSDFEAAKARRDIDQDAVTALIANATKTLQES